MTAPEVMKAFEAWRKAQCAKCDGCERLALTADAHTCIRFQVGDAYPLYIGGPHAGRWYVRERHPGVRVWRAEEDGGFALMDARELEREIERGIRDRHAAKAHARRNSQRF